MRVAANQGPRIKILLYGPQEKAKYILQLP
jgi:hypothetical protein